MTNDELGTRIHEFVARALLEGELAVPMDPDDFNHPERLVRDCASPEELKEKHFDGPWRYEAEEQVLDAFIDSIVPELCKELGYGELPGDCMTMLINEVYEQARVVDPFDDFLEQDLDVDLVLRGSPQVAELLHYDAAALLTLVSLCGVGDPLGVLAKCVSEPELASDKFSRSVGAEVQGAIAIGKACRVVVLARVTVREYFKLLGEPWSAELGITMQHVAGLFDPGAGNGSGFGLSFPRSFKLPGSCIEAVLLEGNGRWDVDKGMRTADSAYGFTSLAFMPTVLSETTR